MKNLLSIFISMLLLTSVGCRSTGAKNGSTSGSWQNNTTYQVIVKEPCNLKCNADNLKKELTRKAKFTAINDFNSYFKQSNPTKKENRVFDLNTAVAIINSHGSILTSTCIPGEECKIVFQIKHKNLKHYISRLKFN